MAAALFALVLLSFASVRSIVMQAAMSPRSAAMADTPMCGMTMGQAPSRGRHGRGAPRDGKAACPYCAAAAHAPVLGHAVPLRPASAFVFTAFQVVASHGPRGPPTREPRARGPPVPPLTA